MKTFHSRIESFVFAFEGILHMLKMEPNARFHLLTTIVVITMGYVLNISSIEFILVLLSIALVWMAELFNTAIENSMDVISKEFHPGIKTVKDISAGAVLICSIAALAIGAIIFIPKILLYV